MKLFRTCIAALAASGSLICTANAATFSFTGTFGADDEVQLFNFSVGATSNITLRTWSYAGGVQADGNVVAAGGFDPILALFDSSGVLIGQNDDGGCALVPADPNTGMCWDTFLTASLAAGDYMVALMQSNNFANGPNLSDGFARTGQPFFTAASGCSNGQFCDVSGGSGNNRTNFWAFDILNAVSASTPPEVPLPAAAWLFLAGAGALAALRRAKNA